MSAESSVGRGEEFFSLMLGMASGGAMLGVGAAICKQDLYGAPHNYIIGGTLIGLGTATVVYAQYSWYAHSNTQEAEPTSDWVD